MGRGRRPTPTAIKELAGNPGKRPLNDAEPTPELVAPEMPKGMAAAARREWEFMVPVLLRLGVLSNIDGKALAAYCDAYAMWEAARRDLFKHGMVFDTPIFDKMGNVIMYDGKMLLKRQPNPSFSQWNTAAKLMKSYLIEFGLTPASRTKLKITKPAEADPMEDFLKRRGAIPLPPTQQPGAPVGFNVGSTAEKKEAEVIADAAVDFDA